MTDADRTAIDQLNALFAVQREARAREAVRTAEERRADLTTLLTTVKSSADAIAAAVSADYGGRAPIETGIAETYYAVEAIRHARRRVAGWMKPTRVRIQPLLQPGKLRVHHVPKGVVGIISPWNYPIQLSLVPLVDALAAGCRVILKPSELTPRTSDLLREMLGKAFPPDRVAVVTGGPDIGAAFAALPFDHLLFTGSAAIGRKVAAAAAANLTPLTLELGGKSPAIVGAGYPLADAAKAIAWAKFVNAGQTCVANDYVIAPAADARKLAAAIVDEARRMYPGGAADETWASIIAETHAGRLRTMLDEARAGGATVLTAWDEPAGSRRLAPSVVIGAPADSRLMREEVFGPILPVVQVESIDEAVATVAAHDKPLAVYVYTDRRTAATIVARTASGGATIGQPFLHMTARDAPFGGVGASGIGAYHGHAGFLTFSHQRPVFTASRRHPSRWLAPPYGRLHAAFLRWRLRK